MRAKEIINKFYASDFANDKNLEEIADYIGANRVIYLDEADLKEAVGIDDLCMACVNNDYPTSVEAGKEFARQRSITKEGAV